MMEDRKHLWASIQQIPTPILKSLRDMCPTTKDGSATMSISGAGMTDAAPPLTYETRQRINAELDRRRMEQVR